RIHAGADAASLAVRADVATPAMVGRLTRALDAGVRHRWDRVNTLEVRAEGGSPEGLTPASVLAGGNALALETAEGWEIIQFRRADLVEAEVWRLSDLLRGQQGTEDAMAAGAQGGAVVVFLGPELPRAASTPAERGLPL